MSFATVVGIDNVEIFDGTGYFWKNTFSNDPQYAYGDGGIEVTIYESDRGFLHLPIWEENEFMGVVLVLPFWSPGAVAISSLFGDGL